MVPSRMKRTPREALAAAREGVGRVSGTATRQVNAPVLGRGGFGADLAATGAHGGAVASEALLAEDIAERVRRLSAAFDRGAQGASLVGGDV